MTPSGFLTDEAWSEIVPLLVKGIRHVVAEAAASHGIAKDKTDQLLVGLCFDGFKTHVKNLSELVNLREANILAVVENRDSSEINQVS